MLHLLTLLPLPLVDDKFPSENRQKLSRPKGNYLLWGFGLKRHEILQEIVRKRSQKWLKIRKGKTNKQAKQNSKLQKLIRTHTPVK